MKINNNTYIFRIIYLPARINLTNHGNSTDE